MKDFLNWRAENHRILTDIEILLYERAVAVADSDIMQADRIREVIYENIENLSDASDFDLNIKKLHK
ncbi:hypothetical protein CAFE_20770 [Caprobacter fermentans]|uniref:Uncharacterized protein n=1 Tax=Caproicibacter fermentans TaxID=2576756 RepID=A0A6N8I1F4_9FIRM|nr:hypothetical protein [Caproicibacter fermentans]MVB11363.1 hypothetical protein [Caproicibacter fermentans]